MQILNLTDASTGIVLSGLSVYAIGEGSSSRSYDAFIDLEEIPGLIKFIDFLNKLQEEKPMVYTEYIFNSKDLRLYAYYEPTPSLKRQQPGWTYGLQVDRYYSGSQVPLELKKLLEIRDSIINLKDKFSKPLNISSEDKRG